MDKCIICQKDIDMNDNDNIKLTCDHIFHHSCMSEYINHNIENNVKFNKCPLCKRFVSVNVQEINNVRVISFTNLSTSLSLIINMGLLYILMIREQWI